jgi:hypothetical protein
VTIFCINNKDVCSNYNLSGDEDPRGRFIPVGNGMGNVDGEKMSPANVCGDPCGKKSSRGWEGRYSPGGNSS